MALHINLYNEIHKAEQARRRDPLKLAGLLGIAVAILLAFWYLYRLNTVSEAESQAGGVAAEWTKLEPRQKKAAEQEQLLLAQSKTNQLLVDRVQNRFYWAPLLQELAAVVPGNIQITTFAGDFDPQKGPSVVLSGVSAGQQPRTVAETFRLALQEKLLAAHHEVTVTFDANSLEDSLDLVNVDGQALPTATFKIRLQIKDKPAEPKQPASPAASKQPK